MPEFTILALVQSVSVQPGNLSIVALENGLQLHLARKMPEAVTERIVQRGLTEKRKVAVKIEADGKAIKSAYWPTIDTIFNVGKLDHATKKIAVMLNLKPAPVFLSPTHQKYGALEQTLRALEGKRARLAIDPATSAIEAVEAE